MATRRTTKRCKHVMAFGDDYGDNATTFHCDLPDGHEGPHVESGLMYRKWQYTVTWADNGFDPAREEEHGQAA